MNTTIEIIFVSKKYKKNSDGRNPGVCLGGAMTQAKFFNPDPDRGLTPAKIFDPDPGKIF